MDRSSFVHGAFTIRFLRSLNVYRITFCCHLFTPRSFNVRSPCAHLTEGNKNYQERVPDSMIEIFQMLYNSWISFM